MRMQASQTRVIEYRAPGELMPYKRNSRKHSGRQVEQLAASIREFGFTAPVLVSGDTIVAGHARVEAAKLAGLKQIPTVSVGHMTETQLRAYVIADNRLAELSEWDKGLLIDELRALDGFDLGFLDLGELDADLGEIAGGEDADETPDDRADRMRGPGKVAGAGAESSPDAKPQQETTRDKDGINYPVYVVLSPGEHKAWRALKDGMSDSEFVKRLLACADSVAAIMLAAEPA